MKFPVENKIKKKVDSSRDKNRILRQVQFTIPYVKELRQLPLVKSVTACILMQQLDYWVNIQAEKKFYKFLEPCPNQYTYKPGDSWTEELGISADEFKTAFGQIGVSYKSKAQYDAAPDKFQGKYYCSYFNRVNRETVYFRNNELVERDLDNLFLRNGESQFVEMGNVESVEADSYIPVEDETSKPVEVEAVELESTETTSDNTAKITTDNNSKREKENTHSPDIGVETNKEIKGKKDSNNSFYSTSLDDAELPANSGAGEIIEGIPVIGESSSSSWTSSSAGCLPSDFKVTDVMREWVEEETQKGNVKSGINIDRATQKFIIYNECESRVEK